MSWSNFNDEHVERLFALVIKSKRVLSYLESIDRMEYHRGSRPEGSAVSPRYQDQTEVVEFLETLTETYRAAQDAFIKRDEAERAA